MTLQAEDIHLVDDQQAWIHGTMWLMASSAALCLNGDVLKDERPLKVPVALETDGILLDVGANRLGEECAMRAMAIGATH